MTTSPLLARRDIALKERLQKALAAVAAAGAVVASIWFTTDASRATDRGLLFGIGLVALTGTGVAIFFLFKKQESAKSKEQMLLLRARIDDDREDRSWLSRIGFNTKRFLAGTIVLLGALIVLAGLGVLALQIYGYLRFGRWESYALLEFVAPYLPWLRSPHSWLGLHKIVMNVFNILPVSLALLLPGLLVAGFGSAIKPTQRS